MSDDTITIRLRFAREDAERLVDVLYNRRWPGSFRDGRLVGNAADQIEASLSAEEIDRGELATTIADLVTERFLNKHGRGEVLEAIRDIARSTAEMGAQCALGARAYAETDGALTLEDIRGFLRQNTGLDP